MRLRKRILKYLILLIVITSMINITINYYLNQRYVEYFNNAIQDAYSKAIMNQLITYYQTYGSFDNINDESILQKEVHVQLSKHFLNREITIHKVHVDGIWRVLLEDEQGNIRLGQDLADSHVGPGYPLIIQDKVVGTLWIIPKDSSVLEFSRHYLLGPLVLRNIWTIIIASMVAFFIAFFFSNYLMERIKLLAEAARKIANGNLDHRVSITSHDELEELSADFNFMADRLQEERQLQRQLQADVVHELRTPLAVSQAILDSLENGVINWNEKTLSSLQEETNRMNRLVSDLFELSRAENKQLTFHKELFLVSDLLARIEESFLEVARRQKVNFGIDIDPLLENALLYVDADRTVQIFVNLLHNALRYTVPGGSIYVSANKGEKTAVISVKDNGTGISAEYLPHIFNRFFRGEKNKALHSGGSGLGLAITKEYTTLQGGSIKVESTVGKGTIFTVILPLDECEY